LISKEPQQKEFLKDKQEKLKTKKLNQVGKRDDDKTFKEKQTRKAHKRL